MKRLKVIVLTAIVLFAAVIAFFTIAPPATTATALSTQTALNRLERYQRPTPLNYAPSRTVSVFTVTYAGAAATADITVGTTNITADAPGSTDYPAFLAAGTQLGDSATGCVRAYDLCKTIDALTDWECDLALGADPFLCADFLTAGANTNALTGAAVVAATGLVRDWGMVIPAQGTYYPIYLHSVTASITGAGTCKLEVYDGTSATGDLMWARTLATTVTSTNEFPGPGLIGTNNTDMVIRGTCSGNTTTAGFGAVQAETHGY